MPQLAFAAVIRDMATASLDVSDGLIADLGHIAQASSVGIEIDLEPTPLSLAGQAWFEGRVDPQAALIQLATGGDDYEIAFTAPVADEPALRREAERDHVRLTRLGMVTAGQGMTVRYDARPIALGKTGFTHR